MIVYRIAKAGYINDLTGAGTRIYGGRWNKKGTGVIYTSENRALATVEYLVHVPISYVSTNLKIASIKIPDKVKIREIKIAELPSNWRNYPSPDELAEIGTQWVLSNKTLVLRIPSVVVEHEFNIFINLSHPDMNRVKISNIEDYKLDNRLPR